jgi:hypothetical protein
VEKRLSEEREAGGHRGAEEVVSGESGLYGEVGVSFRVERKGEKEVSTYGGVLGVARLKVLEKALEAAEDTGEVKRLCSSEKKGVNFVGDSRS